MADNDYEVSRLKDEVKDLKREIEDLKDDLYRLREDVANKAPIKHSHSGEQHGW